MKHVVTGLKTVTINGLLADLYRFDHFVKQTGVGDSKLGPKGLTTGSRQ